MEELSENLEQIINRVKNCVCEWDDEVKEVQLKLEAVLLGTQAPIAQTVAAVPGAAVVAASPHQKKKRVKRLSSVMDEGEDEALSRLSESSVANATPVMVNETIPAKEVEPQPTQPEPQPQPEPEHIFARPMRAAKLKVENCLKEPSINSKLRRPDNPNESTRKIKKEKEEAPAPAKKPSKTNKSQTEVLMPPPSAVNESVASTKKDESIVVIAEKDAPVVEIFSEEDDASSSSSVVPKKKPKRDAPKPQVKVKKEKISLSEGEAKKKSLPTVVPETPEIAAATLLKHEASSSVEETLQSTSSTANTTSTAVRAKRGRKKKEFNHRPIKEERLSGLSGEDVAASPVSTRTRSGSTTKPRPTSVYEDAVDSLPQAPPENNQKPDADPVTPTAANICNETVAMNNATMQTACNATFVANQANSTFAMPAPQTTFIMESNPNSTVTISNDATKKPNGSLGDATFDVRDPPANDSIMTEDDSFDKPLAQRVQLPPPPPPPVFAKVLKSKAKLNELFNPCVRSPVKKKVEAFENHAQVASQEMRLKTRSKRAKENSEPELPSIRDLKSSNTVTTPVIGKPHAPVLGRFLTPTQQSNTTPTACQAKKLPNSASKIMPFPTSKQALTSNLKSSSSTSSQSLSRENSEDDLKKGFNKLQQLAEERKKKRELKHQQAALQREAKEKERAERLRKIMKEREEKNRKKALEIEQKKRELEEINRNLKLQEEREQKQHAAYKTKVDAAEVARQERDLLEQMKLQKMKMPPPPKQANKYNFNMLHSDDSTDEEGKTSYKRPTPPLWSKSSVRAEHITNQAYLSSDIIDSFFSVQPMTPDLKAIFPNIDPRYLKRNSSAIWQTPPRYSEMPKY